MTEKKSRKPLKATAEETKKKERGTTGATSPAWKPLDYAKIEQAGYEGLSVPYGVARRLQVDYDTARRHFDADPLCWESYQAGQALFQDRLEQLGRGNAVGDKAMPALKPGQATMLIFALKCKVNWTEIQRVEHTVDVTAKARELADKFGISIDEAERRLADKLATVKVKK
jgi:hypothetical protein